VPVDPKSFPPLVAPAYGPAQLHEYLAELVSQGYTVNRDAAHENIFYLPITDTYRIRISVSAGRSQVQLQFLTNVRRFLDVTSLSDLEKALAQLVTQVPGMTWPSTPTTVRLQAQTPATNYRKLSGLVGTSNVSAIFDPYLDNRTLEEISVILSFGSGSVADGIRILGGIEKSRRVPPTFTAQGVAAWLRQQGVSGEARTFPAKTEHRRFLLLDSGSALITGHSLNSPHQNEAARVEPGGEDRDFFDATWAGAVVLA
jgi:hypothetical protein